MWLLFGAAAMIAAVLNVVWTIRRRDAKWFRFISLACTAFTLCAFLKMVNGWVSMEDWSALMDVIPTLSRVVWILTGASVALNSISLFRK